MLAEQIEAQLKEALRARDAVTVSALRMLKSALDYALLEKGGRERPPTDAEVVAVVQKQVKQRRDSIASFEQGGRADLAAKERAELGVLERFLPQPLGAEELTNLIRATIAEVGATSKAQIGAVMKAVMPKVAGRADGKQVNQLVQQLLGSPPAA